MAAAGESIKVEGLNRALRELKRVRPELAGEIKRLNLRLARELTPEARARVPVDSGDLRDTLRAGATQRSGVVRAGKAAVPYAGPIHFGWPARNIAPQPFLWDALDARRATIQREYLERVTAIVKAAT